MADKSDQLSCLPTTAVSCSVLFPLMKEGSESLVLPHQMLFRPAPLLLSGFFLPEVIHKTVELCGADGGDTGMCC